MTWSWITTLTLFFSMSFNSARLGNPTAVDADGLLIDVDVQSVEDNPPIHEDKTLDVDQFFYTAVGSTGNKQA